MKVSVCMATYNGEKYLKEQLESILCQLNNDDEVIISDDGSSDETIPVIRRLNDSRIKVIINDGPRGYTNNFENSLRHSTGGIIFLADQDDVWLPGKVNKYIELLEHYDFVVGDCRVVDDKLRELSSSHFKSCNVKKGFFYNLAFPRYVGACMAFNRNVLSMALPFPGNTKYIAHDYWLSLIAELKFNVCLLNEPSMLYRRHSSNASTGGMKSKNAFSHKVMVRIISCLMLIKRILSGGK
ncbi:glycosyltransferase family 2 protein [Aeromonas caviae]|uniref:glycosyltransferase family 2 protein n=1 Tax=Aeromonas caviae TaxID=648 RepID=UPI002B46C05F|nr:glycosyltransferase family 2 protein [Aeromonas caviae]